MLHVVRQIQRHFPVHDSNVAAVSVALSLSALLVGFGLFMSIKL
jgi:hypothetical protein